MEPTLPKLTARVLESEVIDTKYSPKQRSRKPVKKRDIGWPSDFRHSSHIGFMNNNSSVVDGVVQIEVDGKFVYVDSNSMERIQNSNLSSPVLEGREWAVDAPPASVSPQRRPRPKRIPVLADTTENVFAQPVSSVDTPNAQQSIYENIPVSTKKMPAPPPPPKTKKPALKPLPMADEATLEMASLKAETEAKVAQIEEKINTLSEELVGLRREKAALLAKVAAKEEEQKISKPEVEYEPYIQAHVVGSRESRSSGLSTDYEINSTRTPEPDDEPHSPVWDDGLPEAIEKVSLPPEKEAVSEVLSLKREEELEKVEIRIIKQSIECISVPEKVEMVKAIEPLTPTKDNGRPIPPPRKKISTTSTEKPAPRIYQLHKSTDSEIVRL